MKRAVFLYDRSGTMAEPFVKAGWFCVCIDNEGPAGVVGKVLHIRRDARELGAWAEDHLPGVGFFAAFPPCDHLAVSGARWFRGKGLRKLAESIELFAIAAEWAEMSGAPYLIENPVSTISTYWRRPDHTFHPWHFTRWHDGDCYTKKTCLWTGGGFVMPPAAACPECDPDDRIHKAPPSADRKRFRSATPLGFARAVFNANFGPNVQN